MKEHITYTKPQGKFRPLWTARIGDVECTGKTKEEATDALFAKVRKSIAGSYMPTILSHCGYIALIYRELDCWFYHIREASKSGAVTSNLHAIGGGTRQETERAARRHLADYALDAGRSLEEAASIIEHEQDHVDFLRNTLRDREIARIMHDDNVDWQTANERYDGIVRGVK